MRRLEHLIHLLFSHFEFCCKLPLNVYIKCISTSRVNVPLRIFPVHLTPVALLRWFSGCNRSYRMRGNFRVYFLPLEFSLVSNCRSLGKLAICCESWELVELLLRFVHLFDFVKFEFCLECAVLYIYISFSAKIFLKGDLLVKINLIERLMADYGLHSIQW